MVGCVPAARPIDSSPSALPETARDGGGCGQWAVSGGPLRIVGGQRPSRCAVAGGDVRCLQRPCLVRQDTSRRHTLPLLGDTFLPICHSGCPHRRGSDGLSAQSIIVIAARQR